MAKSSSTAPYAIIGAIELPGAVKEFEADERREVRGVVEIDHQEDAAARLQKEPR